MSMTITNKMTPRERTIHNIYEELDAKEVFGEAARMNYADQKIQELLRIAICGVLSGDLDVEVNLMTAQTWAAEITKTLPEVHFRVRSIREFADMFLELKERFDNNDDLQNLHNFIQNWPQFIYFDIVFGCYGPELLDDFRMNSLLSPVFKAVGEYWVSKAEEILLEQSLLQLCGKHLQKLSDCLKNSEFYFRSDEQEKHSARLFSLAFDRIIEILSKNNYAHLVIRVQAAFERFEASLSLEDHNRIKMALDSLSCETKEQIMVFRDARHLNEFLRDVRRGICRKQTPDEETRLAALGKMVGNNLNRKNIRVPRSLLGDFLPDDK